jgi:hypothetical protein
VTLPMVFPTIRTLEDLGPSRRTPTSALAHFAPGGSRDPATARSDPHRGRNPSPVGALTPSTLPSPMPARPALVLLAGLGISVWGVAACAPPDVPPVLGATVEGEEWNPEGPGTTLEAGVSLDPGNSTLTTLLSRPAPDTATVRRTLEYMSGPWTTGGEPRTPRDLIEAAWRVDRAVEALPTLEDWRPLIRAELLAKAGDTTRVRLALEEVDRDSGYLERWGWRFEVEALEQAGDLARARDAAESVAQGDASPATVTFAWFRAGELALAAGDTAAALDPLGWALAAGPGNASARSAARRLADLPRPPDREQDLAIARALLAAGDWQAAADQLTALLRDGEGPGGRPGPDPPGPGKGALRTPPLRPGP